MVERRLNDARNAEEERLSAADTTQKALAAMRRELEKILALVAPTLPGK